MKKKIIYLIEILMFLWFGIPVLTKGVINVGNGTGMAIVLCAIIYTGKRKEINEIITTTWKKTSGKIVISIVGAVFSMVFVVVIIETVFMVKAANNKPNKDVTVVVLGCKVYGEDASLMLVERLDAAYEYLEENKDAMCILSGGKGDEEDISEAECMYRYLTEKGISKERLYKEDKSTTTRENLLFSKNIIEENNLNQDIAIVTNEYHQCRADMIAKSEKLNASAISAKTAWWIFPSFYVRELYGIMYEWAF